MRKRDRVLTKIGVWRTHFPSVAAFVVALALIVISWGIWNLLDIALFPKSPLLAALTAIGLGIVVLYGADTKLRE